jgi:E-phenylitaconyl-CoA hydratase
MTVASPTVLRRFDAGVATVVLHNPRSGNALTRSIYEELAAAWDELEADPAVRVVVFGAAGDRHFCVGGDMSALEEQGLRRAGEDWRLTWRQAGMTKPVVVAVNGTVAGGGLGFVTDGDIVVAADHARFLDTHVAIGQICGYGSLRLVKIIGESEAKRIAIAGGMIDARRAYELGLVNELRTGAEATMARAQEIARLILRASPTAMQRTLELQRAIAISNDDSAPLQAADRAVEDHMAHPDATEGPRAWKENRDPTWQLQAAAESPPLRSIDDSVSVQRANSNQPFGMIGGSLDDRITGL